MVRRDRLVSGGPWCPFVPAGDRFWHGLLARYRTLDLGRRRDPLIRAVLDSDGVGWANCEWSSPRDLCATHALNLARAFAVDVLKVVMTCVDKVGSGTAPGVK